MLASGSRSLGEPPGRVHRGESCAESEPVHHPPRGDVPGLEDADDLVEPEVVEAPTEGGGPASVG